MTDRTGDAAATTALGASDRRSGLRKAVINIVGFAAGLALFAWIVAVAVRDGDWSRLTETSPWLVAALLGCTVVSALLNGATFWITGRTLKPLRFLDMQLLNLVASALNYAPLRLGAIARVAYHVRVDGFTIIQVGAWFAVIGYTVVLGIGSCLLATLLRPELDAVWLVLVASQMVLGGAAARAMVGFAIVQRVLLGVDRVVIDRTSLWGAIGLRVLDLAAYAGRFAVAMAILDVHLPRATDVVVLAVVALAASLIPFGRLGFREACVALTATRLQMEQGQVEAAWAQLALVESAGEALVFLPLGGLGLLWFRQRWLAGRDGGTAAGPP